MQFDCGTAFDNYDIDQRKRKHIHSQTYARSRIYRQREIEKQIDIQIYIEREKGGYIKRDRNSQTEKGMYLEIHIYLNTEIDRSVY